MIVMRLVDLGAQVHYRNVNKETVLMKACAKGNREIMDYLLSHFTTGIEILASLTAQVTHPLSRTLLHILTYAHTF